MGMQTPPDGRVQIHLNRNLTPSPSHRSPHTIAATPVAISGIQAGQKPDSANTNHIAENTSAITTITNSQV